MNRIIFLFTTLIVGVSQSLEVSIENAAQRQKASLGVFLIDAQKTLNCHETISAPRYQKTLISLLKKALEFKGQCAVALHELSHMPTKKQLLAYQARGYDYAIIIDEQNKGAIQWYLFDFCDQTMKANKQITKKPDVRANAYALADSICHVLTNDPPFFSTKLAYCKDYVDKNVWYKYVCIADYDGSHEQVLVALPTITSAPRWNNDPARPLLFYSESTNSNTRLMAVDMKKNRIIASNFDGVNMLPAFCPSGKEVVYCATRGQGECHIYHWAHKKLTRITQNTGNNFGPTFNGDGTKLYFSSDFEQSKPQLYVYDFLTQTTEPLTKEGYNVSPCYNAVRDQVAYAKMVKGVMQLFCYDCKTKKHTQLTTDAAQKEECWWSTCGTFLVCGIQEKGHSRIAAFNTYSKTYTYLTNAQASCSYPVWSGVYNDYPIAT